MKLVTLLRQYWLDGTKTFWALDLTTNFQTIQIYFIKRTPTGR